ncbi:MAG: hypothetical protein AB1553_10520 [Nitrospirota bacterium]
MVFVIVPIIELPFIFIAVAWTYSPSPQLIQRYASEELNHYMLGLPIKKPDAAIILIACLLISACAHQPIQIESLIKSQSPVINPQPLNFLVMDVREDRFREKNIIYYDFQYPISIMSFGDRMFDMPMNIAFEKMLFTRFGNITSGYKTEAKLKAFFVTDKPNPIMGAPVIGLLAAGADHEYHGFLKVDISIFDKNNKFLFQKSFDVDIKERRKVDEERNSVILDMYLKAFNKFAKDLEADLQHIDWNRQR